MEPLCQRQQPIARHDANFKHVASSQDWSVDRESLIQADLRRKLVGTGQVLEILDIVLVKDRIVGSGIIDQREFSPLRGTRQPKLENDLKIWILVPMIPPFYLCRVAYHVLPRRCKRRRFQMW